jgi:uncharacterized protein YbjT (DUF2867 family)
MYAPAGITGKVCSELARNLLADGQRVRASVRNASKAKAIEVKATHLSLISHPDEIARLILKAAGRQT